MKRVLLIDDEKDFCYFVKRNLELSGQFEILCAYSGEEGLEMAQKLKPDIILLDILMPGMDGGDVKAELTSNSETSGIPIVFLTAVVDKKVFGKEVIKEIRNHKFIPKPVSPEELIKAINIVLAGENPE
jgi:CheY-like chemotaxis protein